jgi:hypothetical protein
MVNARDEMFKMRMPTVARLFAILRVIEERQRHLPPNLGVLPWMVQGWLNNYRAEQTLRKDMTLLWKAGYLQRIGGQEGCRRGYRAVRSAPCEGYTVIGGLEKVQMLTVRKLTIYMPGETEQ